MRRLLICAAAALLLAAPAGAVRPLPQAKLLAVYFYADWCPNCKALSPTLGAVRADPAIAAAPILFVTLDLSDKPRIHQSLLLSGALGIGDFVRAQGSATGYVALLDARTHEEIARFDRGDGEAPIKTALLEALGN